MRAAAALAAALLVACALDHHATDANDGLSFVIDGLPLRVSSGTAQAADYGLDLFLTDQPDACLAIKHQPVGAATFFRLRVAPQVAGTPAATVVPPQTVPAPGEAVGDLRVLTDGVPTDGRDAIDGSVAWTANADGTTTIVAIDVGFAGTADRLRAGSLTVPRCP